MLICSALRYFYVSDMHNVILLLYLISNHEEMILKNLIFGETESLITAHKVTNRDVTINLFGRVWK